jgi:hypothetical protein
VGLGGSQERKTRLCWLVPGPVRQNVASVIDVVSISWSKVTMIGVPRMTSVSRLPGSTLTTLGADTGLGLLLGDDLFFGDLVEAADLVGVGYLVVGVDRSGLLDLPFELLLFSLVLGIAKALAAAFLSTYSEKIVQILWFPLDGEPF